VLGVTALASFMMALDALVITTAFATIRADFDRSVETLQWAINIFNLTFAVLLLTGAALGSRFGRRRILVATFSASAGRFGSAFRNRLQRGNETRRPARIARRIGGPLVSGASTCRFGTDTQNA
jgi:MFS family permease